MGLISSVCLILLGFMLKFSSQDGWSSLEKILGLFSCWRDSFLVYPYLHKDNIFDEERID